MPDKRSIPYRFGLLAGLLLALSAGAVQADDQYTFLVAPAIQPQPNEALEPGVKLSIYLDPLKLNWLAWSQHPKTPTLEGKQVIDGESGRMGLIDDGHLVMTVLDPWGNRSAKFEFDRNDDLGNPEGQQAAIFGDRQQVPEIRRTNRQGQQFRLVEGGVADSIVQTAGEGYYTFLLEFKSRTPGAERNDIYLVVDVTDGYRQKPPVISRLRPDGLPYPALGTSGNNADNGWGSLYSPGRDKDNNDDDDDGDDDPTIDPPDDDDDEPDGPFPPPPNPDEPENPVIPEPGTLALIGLGLSGAALLRRRRGTF